MKAQIDCSNHNQAERGRDRRVRSAKHGHRKLEESQNQGMSEYLDKLQVLVPSKSSNTKLSKLEVISNAINYIHDLRKALGFLPYNVGIDMESDVTISEFGSLYITPDDKINNVTSLPSQEVPSFPVISPLCPAPVASQSSKSVHYHHHRQPLGVIPNPI